MIVMMAIVDIFQVTLSSTAYFNPSVFVDYLIISFTIKVIYVK